MENIVHILDIGQVTHDVKYFRFEKPAGYEFIPGQATDVSVNLPEWKDQKRPFTFTSLNNEKYLEFTIKRYADHNGVTNLLHGLKTGDELIVGDVWGAIEYKGEGYFIAGGAGITPFISILRQLHLDGKAKNNHLFFSNKTAADIIYEKELSSILGTNAHYILTKERVEGYQNGYIDEVFLAKNIPDFSKHFYICGPDKMIRDITDILQKLGAKPDTVVFEK